MLDMTNEQFEDLQKRLLLLPEDRRIPITKNGVYSLKGILGEDLAYALIAANPDLELIAREARYVIPDTVAQKMMEKEKR